jgi:hypothetical protein
MNIRNQVVVILITLAVSLIMGGAIAMAQSPVNLKVVVHSVNIRSEDGTCIGFLKLEDNDEIVATMRTSPFSGLLNDAWLGFELQAEDRHTLYGDDEEAEIGWVKVGNHEELYLARLTGGDSTWVESDYLALEKLRRGAADVMQIPSPPCYGETTESEDSDGDETGHEDHQEYVHGPDVGDQSHTDDQNHTPGGVIHHHHHHVGGDDDNGGRTYKLCTSYYHGSFSHPENGGEDDHDVEAWIEFSSDHGWFAGVGTSYDYLPVTCYGRDFQNAYTTTKPRW